MEVKVIQKINPLTFSDLKVGEAFLLKNTKDTEWYCVKLNNLDGVLLDNAVRVLHLSNNKSTHEFCSVRIPKHLAIERINLLVEF